MTKYILSFTLLFALAFVPSGMRATTSDDPLPAAVTAERVTVTVKGQKIRVTGAQGQVLEVYSLTGSLVTTVKIDSNDKTVYLSLDRGYYIAKVGTVTRRFSLL